MNTIILIDDNQEFAQNFTNAAYANGISVVSKISLDGLKELLPKLEHKFAAVVLDIKCLLKDDQAKEDANFIGAALTYLNTFVPGFPRYILTGDESEFDSLKRYHNDEKMYIKKPDDQEKLLIELKDCVKNADTLRLKREHSDIFETFDRGLLSPDQEPILLNLLKNYFEADKLKFRGLIGDIRAIHEGIYKSIHIRNQSVVPSAFVGSNNSPSFSGAFYKHLQGNTDPNNNFQPTTPIYQDSTIHGITKFIHNACSEYLHTSSKTGYSISQYTLRSLINGLLELIIWSKQY